MKKINIFVCHTPNSNNLFINDKLYKNIVGGSFFQSSKMNEKFLRDDTGNNISSKNKTYNELTVQYWAWKNVDLDYYGFCHYRRFISFSQKRHNISHDEHNCGLINVDIMNDEFINEYEILRKENFIEKYDVICMYPIKIERGYNNYKLMLKSKDYHYIKDVDLTLDIIKNKFPKYYEAAKFYLFKSKHNYLYNCWIMNRALFNEYCEFQFGVLSELEKIIDITFYSKQQSRVFGLIGERLFGIFITYLEKKKIYKIKHQEIVFINNTMSKVELTPYFNDNSSNFVIPCNNNYIKYASVLIESMIEHSNTLRNYELIIICDDLTLSSKQRLQYMIKNHPNFVIRYVESGFSKMNFKVMYDGFYSKDVFLKILSPFLLKKYGKGVILDCDTVFRCDPALLYDIDIKNNIIAAVKDIVMQGWINGAYNNYNYYNHCTQTLKMQNPYYYVNSGVFIANFNKYRDCISLEQMLNLCFKPFLCQDQDILNYVFNGKIMFLPIKWNYFISTNEFVKKSINFAPAQSQKEYEENFENCNIIHYAAKPKPWENPDCINGHLWWKYAKNSVFYESIIYNNYLKPINALKVTKIRRIADKVFPIGTKRRMLLKKILPKKGSKIWNKIKKMYKKIFE